jgi:membrane protease YdiL (CAAX protease family)
MRADSANPRDRAQTGETSAPPGRSPFLHPGQPELDELNWAFFGPRGLRAGWSILIFGLVLYFFLDLFQWILSFLVFEVAHLRVDMASPLNTILGEGKRVAALVVSLLAVTALERRRWIDYNLAGWKALRLIAGGAAVGFGAISTLILVLSGGGWLHFGPMGLSGPQILKYAVLWGLAFALVGLFEEGTFRCYLLATLERGLSFWWALAVVGAICFFLAANPQAHSAWGVYAATLVGLLPCAWLQMRKWPRSGFWQAAWASSVGFGFIHTFNRGENWMGVLAAAAVGFVFCVSVHVTGSAWWAIGCHASWDWAESYFYGTADSGFSARGHLLTAIPSGSVLWSGGSAGPEGSGLVFPAILLLLAAMLMLYGRRKNS